MDSREYRRRLDEEFVRLGTMGCYLPSIDELHSARDTDAFRWPILSYCLYVGERDVPGAVDFLDSVFLQTTANWEVCIATPVEGLEERFRDMCRAVEADPDRCRVVVLPQDGGEVEALNRAVSVATGQYVALSAVGMLAPDATRVLSEWAMANPFLCAYCDDAVREADDWSVRIKPAFSPDYLVSFDYIGHTVLLDRRMYADIGGLDPTMRDAAIYDLCLRASERWTIRHIAEPLFFLYNDSDPSGEDAAFFAKAVAGHMERGRLRARLQEGSVPGVRHLQYVLEGNPLVSIIIPNKDHADDLRCVLGSIYGKTEYGNFETIVVDNNSTDEETFTCYHEIQKEWDSCRVVTYTGTFNYSDVVNYGRTFARGEYLLFLNNDTEVDTPQWLTEMLRLAQRPDIGVVGSLLCYPDDTVQHAGVLCTDTGAVWHAFEHLPRTEVGYRNLLVTAHEVAAVTGACQLVPTELFDRVGGYDTAFPITYNDVDFCFRIRERGYRVLWTPDSQLYHYEGKTRGRDESEEAIQSVIRSRTLFAQRHDTPQVDGGFYNERYFDTESVGRYGIRRLPMAYTPSSEG